MSRETLADLNSQTLIGYTSKRGHAWHYRADAQDGEPNHYQHAIPVADIRRRLFHWTPVEADLQAVAITDDGVSTFTDPTRKAIVRPDTGAILGVFSSGYKVHDYHRWLINNVEPSWTPTCRSDRPGYSAAGRSPGCRWRWPTP
jgi:hypothetical protein